MILTDYYKLVHLPDSKSKHRIDCTASTKSYPEFENLRNKADKLFFYFGDVPLQFGGDVHKKADKCLSKTKNISSVFYPGVKLKTFAFGDVKGKTDALLIINSEDYTEFDIFVARGQKNNRLNLWENLVAGEFDFELSELRKRSSPEI